MAEETALGTVGAADRTCQLSAKSSLLPHAAPADGHELPGTTSRMSRRAAIPGVFKRANVSRMPSASMAGV
jgi:hypothetical protein